MWSAQLRAVSSFVHVLGNKRHSTNGIGKKANDMSLFNKSKAREPDK